MIIGNPTSRLIMLFMHCATPIIYGSCRHSLISKRKIGRVRCRRLLHRAHHIAQAAQNQNIAVSDRLIALVGRRYDKIIAQALAFHEAQPALSRPRPGKRGRKKRRTGHNLALRLREHKEGTLRFLADPDVPFTNNEAERDLRMMKLRQKISGGFRSQQGAEDFAILRSLITTARKQGWNIIETLMKTADQLIADLKYA